MRPPWWHALVLSLIAAVSLLTACNCGDDASTVEPAQPTGDGNVFANPSFEEGREPWFSLQLPDFIVSQEQANTGESSALLKMRAGQGDEGSKVFYLVHESNPGEFPELISGYYRVDHWARGTEKQYVQFVVIAFGSDNLRQPYPNHQIRYILAGAKEEPFEIANASFVFLSREEPVLGRWVRFERNLRKDFERAWGAAPKGYDRLRVLFEVRYDDKAPNEEGLEADVYYDDLYMGPAP